MAENRKSQQPKEGAYVVRLNAVDRLVTWVNPRAGIERIRARAALSSLGGAGFVTFGSNRRSMRGAAGSYGSANTEVSPKLEDMRATSRDLWMNANLATSIINRLRTNIVGYGLQMNCRVDRTFLGLSDEAADAWEHNTEREFRMYCRSKNCDASRSQNFWQLQSLACISQLLSGDVFAMFPIIPRAGWPYGTCCQLIESDMVANPWGVMESDLVSGGVKTNDYGEPISYYVLKNHPGGYSVNYDYIEIPAFRSNGIRNLYHVFEKNRPGQNRGVPLLAHSFDPLKQLTRLSDSELFAAVVTSFFTVAITEDSPTGDMFEQQFSGANSVVAGNDMMEKVQELGHGNVVKLNKGEKVEPIDPKRPNGAFAPFWEALAKGVSAASEVPFDVVMLHFQSSYSAARAEILQAYKRFLTSRYYLSWDFCEPFYESWLREAIRIGRISAPGFWNNPAVAEAWSGSEWTGPGMGQINPAVETKAAILRIDNNLSSHQKEVAAMDGDDWDAMLPRIARNKALIREHKIEPATAVTGQKTENQEDRDHNGN